MLSSLNGFQVLSTDTLLFLKRFVRLYVFYNQILCARFLDSVLIRGNLLICRFRSLELYVRYSTAITLKEVIRSLELYVRYSTNMTFNGVVVG